MKRFITYSILAAIGLLCSIGANATTSDAKPAYIPAREFTSSVSFMLDTIPVPVKAAEATSTKQATGKPVATVIKAVPKARKVAVPKPVIIDVKPVKVIKPKIIKPVLKVL